MIRYFILLQMYMTLALHVNNIINQNISMGSRSRYCTNGWSEENPKVGISKITNLYYPFDESVPGNTPIRKLNLFLSHDAGSEPDLEDGYHGNHGSVTQETSLASQYYAGVRMFDVRVAENKHLYHEWFKVNRYFSPAWDALAKLQEAAIHFGDICVVKYKGPHHAELQEKLVNHAFEKAGTYEHCASGLDYINELEGKGKGMPFYEQDSTIDQMVCHCVLLRDDVEFKMMEAKKKEENQLIKISDLAGDKVSKSIWNKFVKACTADTTLRLGMTSTGLTNSPLCIAYANHEDIETYAKSIVEEAKKKGCNVFLGLDGAYGLITGRHCKKLGCAHE